MDTQTTEQRLRGILTPRLLIASYNLKWPYAKGQKLSGAQVGRSQFSPEAEYYQAFYDLVFHQALIPLSEIPLGAILKTDLTRLLPDPDALDYPEQCLGLITLLDQARPLCRDYGLRYCRAFFDPIAEKLFRQLMAQPDDKRPDSIFAWLSRGYTFEDWLVRVLWIWGPPMHSDTFMVHDRKAVKQWLHYVRREVEHHARMTDPLAHFEASDVEDFTVWLKVFAEGPPQQSFQDPSQEATVADYSFWWIRTLNSLCAIIDFAGRYPFWVRHKGEELSEKDKQYMDATNSHFLEAGTDDLFRDIREDTLSGVWKPLPLNEALESQRSQGSLQTTG